MNQKRKKRSYYDGEFPVTVRNELKCAYVENINRFMQQTGAGTPDVHMNQRDVHLTGVVKSVSTECRPCETSRLQWTSRNKRVRMFVLDHCSEKVVDRRRLKLNIKESADHIDHCCEKSLDQHRLLPYEKV